MDPLYILGYITVGVITTLLGAMAIKFVGCIYKDRIAKRSSEMKREQEHKEIMDKLESLEPMLDLVIASSKTQLINETKHYSSKGHISLHKKSNLLFMCDRLSRLPHSNGDVTECRKTLEKLPIEEVK